MSKKFNKVMHFNDIENAYTNHQYPDAECMLTDTNNVPDSMFTPEGVKVIPKKVTENGTYYASQDGANGYDEVVVDVEGHAEPVLRHLVCSHNGTFLPEEGVDGFDVVTTNVHPANPYVGNFTENQTIHVDGEYNGVDITVDVDAITNELTVTENGTYTPEAGVDGFSEVVVNVPATEPDVFYRYIPAVHGTIVLRQKYTKVLGQYEVENRVFFNGYHLTDYDTIPAEIYNYIPDIDVSSANWTDNTSTTQNGWISIAKHSYNQLRCYTDSWSSFLSNIDIWAVVDLAGGNAQTLHWSDPYDVEPAPELMFNAYDLQIATENSKYIYPTLDIPLETGCWYLANVIEPTAQAPFNTRQHSVVFKRIAAIQNIEIPELWGGSGGLRVTNTTAGMYEYSNAWRNMYLKLTKLEDERFYDM